MELSRKISAVIILAIIVVCTSGYLQYLPKVLAEVGLVNFEKENAVLENEESENPVSEKNILKTGISENQVLEKIGGLPFDKISGLVQRAENAFKHVAFETLFIDLNGGVQRVLDKNIILDIDPVNDVYKLKNGQLTAVSASPSNIVEDCAQNVIALDGYLEGQGIDFLYLNAPVKNSKFDNQLPYGVTDYLNEDMDRFLEIIKGNDVKVVDLRQLMYDAGVNQYDMFIRTDHHWNMNAGLWAAEALFENALNEYQSNPDIFDIQNYDIKAHKNSLGSYGRRVGRWYGGTDDLAIITPKFETNLSLSIPSMNIERSGDFSEVMYNYDILKEDVFNSYQYYVYIAQEPNLTIIKNKSGGNGKKCLLIEDSFGCVFSPFAALEFSEIHAWRQRLPHEETLYEYIREYNPDLVIMLFFGEQLANKNNGTFIFD